MGGNLIIGGQFAATPFNLKKVSRSDAQTLAKRILLEVNRRFNAENKFPLWAPELLKSGLFLSGSSKHFFNTKISDSDFVKVKPVVGDIDVMVDKTIEPELQLFLSGLVNRPFLQNITLVGFQKGNEQFSALFKHSSGCIQVDFEFVEFSDNFPTNWARFSHCSSWRDLQIGIKGVFHKWLIQSFCVVTAKDFVLQKTSGRGKNKTTTYKLMKGEPLYTFAVSSKNGGGLRKKYEFVTDPETNKQVIHSQYGLEMMTQLPTVNYETDLANIFKLLFGHSLSESELTKVWSFSGLISLIKTLTAETTIEKAFTNFIQRLLGEGAQGMYRNDPQRDVFEKLIAIKYMAKQFNISLPANLDSLIKTHVENYKMVPVEVSSIGKAISKVENEAQTN